MDSSNVSAYQTDHHRGEQIGSHLERREIHFYKHLFVDRRDGNHLLWIKESDKTFLHMEGW